MSEWKNVSARDKSYNVHESPDGTCKIYRDNSYVSKWHGTPVGSASSMKVALDVIKSDSGAKKVDIR